MASTELTARAAVPARAALAGNPSDGYGGAVLAFTVADFCARVEARTAAKTEIRPASELVRAAAERFARELVPTARPAVIKWRTSIPRSVGLGGSSALVIATMRALCGLHWTSPSPGELARIALAVETEDLGIAAGLQDRVAQAYGGVTFMDFAACVGPEPAVHGHYESLATDLLPPLLLAWRADARRDSGPVHSDLRGRFERAEPAVLNSIDALAAAAREARGALLSGDRAALGRAVDASFDARARMMELDPRHVQMIEIARACGASANYAGSGGAVVCVCRDEAHRAGLSEELRGVGCGAFTPSIGPQMMVAAE